MKRVDTVTEINKWMVWHDLTDVEYIGNPSKDAKRINGFIMENINFVKYKDKDLVDEYCNLIKENLCRGLDPDVKNYIVKHAKAYRKAQKRGR